MEPTDRYSTGSTLTAEIPLNGNRPSPVWLRIPVFQPRATIILLAVLAAVFVFEIIYGGGSLAATEQDRVLFPLGMKDNTLIIEGQWWRLVTATFLHAGILHIAFNGYFLYIFGMQVEQFYGWRRFIAIYSIAGLAGSVASFAFSQVPSVGASGAIFGLVGATGSFFWMYRRLLGNTARVWLWNTLAIVILEFIIGPLQSQVIDNWAHAGGVIGGFIAGIALVPRYNQGTPIGPDELMLRDSQPPWAAPAMMLAMLAAEVGMFALALAIQKGIS